MCECRDRAIYKKIFVLQCTYYFTHLRIPIKFNTNSHLPYPGDISEAMIAGIDNSETVIVFVTKTYMEKVNSSNHNDNCKFEFRYARRKKTPKLMFPVVSFELSTYLLYK